MAAKTWNIDTSNSEVSFKAKKLGLFTIKGTIKDFMGDVAFSREAIADANFNVCVSPSTIDTGNVKRDEHLKSKDFFHVNEYPQVCFQSTSVQEVNGVYQALGNLTMSGITKELTITFSFSDGSFQGSFDINRLDFKLGRKIPAFVVGRTINVSVRCQSKSV